MSIAMFLVMVAVAGAGVLLLWLALRGRRINDHPTCRWCGFDLLGVFPAGVTCPECGAGLKRAKAVRMGARRKMWLTAGLATLMIVLPGAALGLAFFAAVTGTDLYKHMPLGVILWQARYATPASERAIADEVYGRMVAKALSKEQAASAVDVALEFQGDLNHPWQDAWGTVVERADLDGVLSDEQRSRWQRQAAVLEIEARPRVRAGDVIPVRVRVKESRVGPSENLAAMLWSGQHMLGGMEAKLAAREGGVPWLFGPSGRADMLGAVYLMGSKFNAGTFGMPMAVAMGVTCPEGLAPGKYSLSVGIILSPTDASGRGVFALPTKPKADDAKVARPVLTCQVEVVPKDTQTVTAVAPTPELEAALAKALVPPHAQLMGTMTTMVSGPSVGGMPTPPATSRAKTLSATVDLTNAPVEVAFDVFAREGDRQWRVGTITTGNSPEEAGEGGFGAQMAFTIGAGLGATPKHLSRGLAGTLGGLQGKTIDLIFRPNIEAARRTLDQTRFYNGEIVVKNVRLQSWDAQGGFSAPAPPDQSPPKDAGKSDESQKDKP